MKPFWSQSPEEVFRALESSSEGLSSAEAKARLERYGPNALRLPRRFSDVALFLNQFKSPLILLLIAAALIAYATEDRTDAVIILIIVALSGMLGFWQERSAARTVERLLAMVTVTASVLRDGRVQEIPLEEVVPGDVIQVAAGDVVPADALLLEARDLFVDEAIVTGEPFPTEKTPGVLPPETPLARRSNVLSMGTHVVGGYGKALVVKTGKATEFGHIASHLRTRRPETAFERGIRHFSYMLAEIALLMTFFIFAVNIYFERPFIDTLLFSLALAVGITPALLPAIVTVNLAYGARHMAKRQVIVKRLVAIEDFGSMNVFCSDKTGTLTEGRIVLHKALDPEGREDAHVLELAYLNAAFESGYRNPIDEALRAQRPLSLEGYRKLDELPFDFMRKRLSVLVATPEGRRLLITKGAFDAVFPSCSKVAIGGREMPLEGYRKSLEKVFVEASSQGFRVIAAAYKAVEKETMAFEDETGLVFEGFLLFHDPLKPDIRETIERLRRLGVRLKVLTGDNRHVSAHVAEALGIPKERLWTGEDVDRCPERAFLHKVDVIDVFAELTPAHKERIVRTLVKSGSVVGFMGDGVNDVTALHAADVGVSVHNAVDVAKEAADFVLLEKSLKALGEGIVEGRKSFINTLKYIFMTTSANFGNIFSMAGASLMLPFLPMLPKQVLATNLLTDLPVMTLPSDAVDPEWVHVPRRWNLPFIKRFMVTFGLLSSAFDFLTFAVLLDGFKAGAELFWSGWFQVSVLTEIVVLWTLRTRRPAWRSRLGHGLLESSLAVAVFTLALPYTLLGDGLSLVPLPASTVLVLLGIVFLYGIANEVAKRLFYKRFSL